MSVVKIDKRQYRWTDKCQ